LDFENREAIFQSVHRSFKFGILTLSGTRRKDAAEFVFFATRIEHTEDNDRRFSLSAEDIALLNPSTRTCSIFRSGRDAELTKAIYRRVPILSTSGWKLELRRLLNSADDSGDFLSDGGPGRIPLYQAKYFHQFDHRWATYDNGSERDLSDAERSNPHCVVVPQYYYPADDVLARFGTSWPHLWALAWRRVARSTDERTFIATIIPSLAIPHTARVILPRPEHIALVPALLANVCALVFDYVVRQKVVGIDVSSFIVEQLALLPPETYCVSASWTRGTSVVDWLTPRVLELVYTAWDLEPFAGDVGHKGPPFSWNPARRAILRAELDAAFFHLYGLERVDAGHVLDTFPIVRAKEEREHGAYRTKCLVLECYDALAAAIASGKPYVSPLSPPPADPRLAHPAREAEIVPLSRRIPAPRPLPAWGHDIFAEAGTRAGIAPKADAWSTSLSGEQLGISALGAVLRGLAAPTAREDIERAVVLVLLPRLMQSRFDGASAKRWRSVIGKRDFAVASVTALAIPWGNVLRKAIQQRVLVEGLNGLWHAGPDVGDAPAPALDARALVALSWLATAPAQDATVEQELGGLRVA